MKSFLTVFLKHRVLTVVVSLLFFLSAYVLLKLTGASDARQLTADAIAVYFLAWGLYSLLSETRREEVQKRFLLMTTTIVFLLALVEAPAWLRVVDYRQVFSTPEFTFWNKRGFVTDSELGWIPRPHHRSQGRFMRGEIGELLCLPPSPPQEYDLRYDQHGFRNDSDLSAADIAVIGDSYVESPQVPSAMLLTTVLASLQKNAVANLGMSGYGPQQELAVLKRYALELRPKTIVWVFYEGNDLENVHKYEATLRHVTHFVPTQWERSFTQNALWALIRLRQGCVPKPNVEKQYGKVVDAEGRQRPIYFLVGGEPLSSEEFEALNKTRSLLATAYQLCRERGIRFVVAFAPTEYRTYHGLANLVDISEEVKGWIVNDLPERLRAVVAGISPDIDYLDLTPIFRAEAGKGTLLFLPDDIHWAPDGHRVVAEALHNVLSSQTSLQNHDGDLR